MRDHEEQRSMLGEISSYVSLILAPLSLISIYLQDRDLKNLAATSVVFLGCTAWLILTARRAKRAFNDHTVPLPSPAWLWTLLYNRVPSGIGTSVDTSNITRILVILEETNVSIAEEIRQSYAEGPLIVDIFVCAAGSSNGDAADKGLPELRQSLSRSDAVYFAWSHELESLKWPEVELVRWSTAHSHKPILAINTIPDATYSLPFNTVPIDQASAGVWRLLARSSERGRMWRNQARNNRSVFLVACSLFVLVVAIASAAYFREIQQKEVSIASADRLSKKIAAFESREALERKSVRSMWTSASTARSTIETLLGDWREEGQAEGTLREAAAAIQTTLHAYASAVLRRLISSQSLTAPATGNLLPLSQPRAETLAAVSNSSVGFWRPATFYNEEVAVECVCEVGWSDQPGKQTCFLADQNSIIGCAFQHDALVLWQREALDNEDVGAWSLDGQDLAHWDKDGNLNFTDSGDSCSIHIDSKGRQGLVCFAAAAPGEEEKRGICLDSHAAPELLREELTTGLLKSALSVALAAPDALLPISEKAEGLCLKDWSKKARAH